jgi:hypothetical protein
MNKELIKADVERIFKENDFHYYWWIQDGDGSVVVDIDYGSWYLEHMSLKDAMSNNHYSLIDFAVLDDEDDSNSVEYVFKYMG